MRTLVKPSLYLLVHHDFSTSYTDMYANRSLYRNTSHFDYVYRRCQLYNFRWEDLKAARPGTKSNADRQYVNCSRLDAWARSLAVEQDPWLVLPDGEVVKVHM